MILHIVISHNSHIFKHTSVLVSDLFKTNRDTYKGIYDTAYSIGNNTEYRMPYMTVMFIVIRVPIRAPI